VIEYVQQRYGERQVAQIITFGTLSARGVLRDVGACWRMPYGQVDKLTKLGRRTRPTP
jgi:DNA polymerase-3 subunit alpha